METYTINWADAAYFLPEAFVVLTFLGCVLADILTRGKNHALTLGVLLAGLVAAGVMALAKPPVASHGIFGDMVVVGAFASDAAGIDSGAYRIATA